ncbi:MAG TPA: alpha/beta hydrolase [Pseudomonas sp.]|uniref:alpha/beta fold hydrolase n=1 Tax=Pseudomonas sp. TaxID=306 RepID=UPI002C7D8412|nr:alpha/beta hydrolase [Pseudomonas sp.]HTO18605.1 alpha/beta hydrolase [Pseudomonas sp.]
MKAEIAVLDIQGTHRIYTELHRAKTPAGTILLVNGSLSTLASFAQTTRYLQPHFNVVLFDLPYAGHSRRHNHHQRLLSREDEADIIVGLIEHFKADHLLSFSWGGIASLKALARRPRHLRKAAIYSFSPVINGAMLDYLERGSQVLGAGDRDGIAALVNGTIGKHLPSLYQRYNHRHIRSLELYEYAQMKFHVDTVLHHEGRSCVSQADAIDVPLLFLNGEWDEYTTPQDARLFAQHARHCDFHRVARAGHFIDIEHKRAGLETRDAVLDFLLAPAIAQRQAVAV